MQVCARSRFAFRIRDSPLPSYSTCVLYRDKGEMVVANLVDILSQECYTRVVEIKIYIYIKTTHEII